MTSGPVTDLEYAVRFGEVLTMEHDGEFYRRLDLPNGNHVEWPAKVTESDRVVFEAFDVNDQLIAAVTSLERAVCFGLDERANQGCWWASIVHIAPDVPCGLIYDGERQFTSLDGTFLAIIRDVIKDAAPVSVVLDWIEDNGGFKMFP